uniref:Uncharacterized protein n=1 Tax=Arundo donax TaxID=35708 RepID=A0A0A9HHB0_ARUDO
MVDRNFSGSQSIENESPQKKIWTYWTPTGSPTPITSQSQREKINQCMRSPPRERFLCR